MTVPSSLSTPRQITVEREIVPAPSNLTGGLGYIYEQYVARVEGENVYGRARTAPEALTDLIQKLPEFNVTIL
jgi:hypothetical protein